MASAAVPAMSSAAPAPASSGGGEGGAPAAQPGGAGGRTPGIAGAIESILDEGSQQQQRNVPQARAAETPAQRQSRLELALQGLPDEERNAALQELNHLRTQAGRAEAEARRRAAEPQDQGDDEISHEQRVAEAALIAAVTAQPARLHELAAMAGVEPDVLAKAAGLQGGAAPGAPATARDPRVLADPGLFPRVYAEFEARSDPGHAESWSKPLIEIRSQAENHRQKAWEHQANARIAESPQAKEDYLALAKQSNDAARQLELRADQHMSKQFFGLMNVLNRMLSERIAPFEKLAEAAQAKDAHETKMQGQRQSMVNAAASVLAPEGHALFGPQGYGVFDVDAAGNVTAISPNGGAEMLEAAEQVMLEYNLPMNAAGLARALHLLSMETTHSDGANGNPAGARPGGGTATLPAGAPGSFGQRPSLAGDIMSSLSPRY